MDAIGGHHVKWSKPGSETHEPVFSHMWINICTKHKDKHIHENKHDHTQTQT
jgi:hypothetical protein